MLKCIGTNLPSSYNYAYNDVGVIDMNNGWIIANLKLKQNDSLFTLKVATIISQVAFLYVEEQMTLHKCAFNFRSCLPFP